MMDTNTSILLTLVFTVGCTTFALDETSTALYIFGGTGFLTSVYGVVLTLKEANQKG